MLNVKQSYNIAKDSTKNLNLVMILDFGKEFGFLFTKNKETRIIGSSYILVNKTNKEVSFLPTTPDNVLKINSARKISLTIIR